MSNRSKKTNHPNFNQQPKSNHSPYFAKRTKIMKIIVLLVVFAMISSISVALIAETL